MSFKNTILAKDLKWKCINHELRSYGGKIQRNGNGGIENWEDADRLDNQIERGSKTVSWVVLEGGKKEKEYNSIATSL